MAAVAKRFFCIPISEKASLMDRLFLNGLKYFVTNSVTFGQIRSIKTRAIKKILSTTVQVFFYRINQSKKMCYDGQSSNQFIIVKKLQYLATGFLKTLCERERTFE